MRQVLVTSGPALASAVAAIAALDLSMVAERLSVKGWEQERIDAATSGYKAFLIGVRNGGELRPEPDVDAVWHEHILHTKRYAQDCESIFGAFLHHNPESEAAALCVASIGVKALCVASVTALCVASVDISRPAN